MKNKIFRYRQKGQAMIETALMLPLLVMLLMAVGYFGSAITMQHNITVAARYAARSVAMESTRNPDDRTEGTFMKITKLGPKLFRNYATRALPGFDPTRINVKPVPKELVIKLIASSGQGTFEPIVSGRGYAFLYQRNGIIYSRHSTRSGQTVAQLNGMRVGLGTIFYGALITYRLKELDWMAKFLFKKKDGITLQAVSLMPAELPMRSMFGEKYGVMDLNQGIFDIITTNVRTDDSQYLSHYQYEDLVK